MKRKAGRGHPLPQWEPDQNRSPRSSAMAVTWRSRWPRSRGRCRCSRRSWCWSPGCGRHRRQH